MAETAGSVQFGLTLSPLDRTLQPSTEETLERLEVGEQHQGPTDGGGGGGGRAWHELQRGRRGGRESEKDGLIGEESGYGLRGKD